jgi:hypothetical protein
VRECNKWVQKSVEYTDGISGAKPENIWSKCGEWRASSGVVCGMTGGNRSGVNQSRDFSTT